MIERKRIKNRRNNAQNWTTDNPVLMAGEFGVELDTKRIKVGDGTTAWNDLPYCTATSEEITEIVESITYNKTEIDNALNAKADAADVYTKTEVDDIKTTIEGEIPTDTSDLTNGAGYITLNDVPAQVQSDWTEADSTSPAFIKNKPSMPSAQVQADWNEVDSSAVDFIKNKPTIPTKTSDLTNDSGFITDADVKSYKDFPQGWRKNGTLSNLISDINSDQDAVTGMSYMATVSYSDLPGNLTQAEIKVDIMDELQGLGKNILFTITSSNTSPYHWEYTSAYGAAGTWRSWANSSDIPTATSDLTNDSGYITINDVPAQVQSNWNESDTTSAAYIQNKPTIPTATSDLTNDSGYITINDVPAQEQADWNEADSSDPAYIKNKPVIPAAQVQSDWNQSDNTAVDYIKNKPSIPSGQVQSDWNQTNQAEVDFIKNKPSIPTATSDLQNDSGYITISDVPAQVQSDWNEADSSDPAYIANKPVIPAAQIQSDWNQSNSGAVDYIKNKPTIPTDTTDLTNGAGYITLNDVPAQEQADWNESDSSDPAYIKNKPTIPTATSDLQNDSGFITLSDVPAQEQADWNESDSSDPAYIQNKPTIYPQWFGTQQEYDAILIKDPDTVYHIEGSCQIQSDWNQSDSTAVDYIKNKPSIPSAQVNADWNAVSGVAQILNKPTIPTATSDLTNDSGYITLSDVPAQVNADWNAVSGVAQILNKPTIPTVPTDVSAFNNDAGYLDSTDLKDELVDTYNFFYEDPDTGDLTPYWVDFGSMNDILYNYGILDIDAGTGDYVYEPDYNDLQNKPSIPTATSDLQNDSGYITISDVPAQVNSDWNAVSGVAQILNKPTIPSATSDLTNDSGYITISDVPAQVNADWNSNSGASEILNKPSIPTATSDLTNDSGFITISDVPAQEQADWNQSDNSKPDYIKNKPTIPAAPVQSNWNESDTTSLAYIQNKPNIPSAQVNSDWNAVSGVAQILNKPSIPANTSDLNNDSGYITISDIPAQVQSDWNEVDSSDPAYIANKPVIPAAQVNSDWNAVSGVSQILNKPTIPAAQVNSDWNAASGVAQILNKPSMSTETLTFTLQGGTTQTIIVYIQPTI